jgi:hypothetical protein
MGKSFDHRPPGGIGKSRKGGVQLIHNLMVVNFIQMSIRIFVFPRKEAGFDSDSRPVVLFESLPLHGIAVSAPVQPLSLQQK